jgi:hypothetical protein
MRHAEWTRTPVGKTKGSNTPGALRRTQDGDGLALLCLMTSDDWVSARVTWLPTTETYAVKSQFINQYIVSNVEGC